jgi:hypothetical protein
MYVGLDVGFEIFVFRSLFQHTNFVMSNVDRLLREMIVVVRAYIYKIIILRFCVRLICGSYKLQKRNMTSFV